VEGCVGEQSGVFVHVVFEGKHSTLAVSFVSLWNVVVGSCFGVLPWKRCQRLRKTGLNRLKNGVQKRRRWVGVSGLFDLRRCIEHS